LRKENQKAKIKNQKSKMRLGRVLLAGSGATVEASTAYF
jgi:hypothetical protein